MQVGGMIKVDVLGGKSAVDVLGVTAVPHVQIGVRHVDHAVERDVAPEIMIPRGIGDAGAEEDAALGIQGKVLNATAAIGSDIQLAAKMDFQGGGGIVGDDNSSG